MTNPKIVSLDDDTVARLAQATADAMPRPGVPWTSAQRWADASSDAAQRRTEDNAKMVGYCELGNQATKDYFASLARLQARGATGDEISALQPRTGPLFQKFLSGLITDLPKAGPGESTWDVMLANELAKLRAEINGGPIVRASLHSGGVADPSCYA